jgi:signal transduction histidine kinase/GGDEF domain-containing protein
VNREPPVLPGGETAGPDRERMFMAKNKKNPKRPKAAKRLPRLKKKLALSEREGLESKKKEEALRKRENIVEGMIKNLSEGVLLLDNHSRVRVINPRARKILGLKSKGVIESKALLRKLKNLGLERAMEESREKRHLIKKEVNLSEKVLACEISPLSSGARSVTGTILLLRDITREKEIDRMKNDFISIVSHELRTPLSITREGISLILEGIPGGINEKQHKILATAKGNIDRLSRIVNSLLDISRIEAGKIEINKRLVSISSLIRQVAANYETAAREKGLEIRVKLPEKKISLYADTDKLMQIFTNLMNNAVHFTPEGMIELAARETKGKVVCSVKDTGIGISKKDLPKVFSRFQQFGRVAGAGPRGTGLGLSIARELVEMHRGKISVDSTEGKGTKFTFTLPKYTPEVLFKEYVNNEMALAMENDTELSIIGIRVSGADDSRKDFSKKKYPNLLGDIEQVLSTSLRRADDFVLALGGQIVIVLPNCTKENALRLVDLRLAPGVKEHIEKKELDKKIKVFFGCVAYPVDGRLSADLIGKVKKIGPW